MTGRLGGRYASGGRCVGFKIVSGIREEIRQITQPVFVRHHFPPTSFRAFLKNTCKVVLVS